MSWTGKKHGDRTAGWFYPAGSTSGTPPVAVTDAEGYYFDKQLPSGNPVVAPDERTGLGTDRPQQPGRALSGDGATGDVDLGAALDIGANATITAWVDINNLNRGLFGTSPGNYWLYLSTTTLFTTGGVAAAADSIPYVWSPGWAFLAMTKSGTAFEVYRDNVNIASLTVGVGSAGFRYLMSRSSGFLLGEMAIAKAWSKTLSTDELTFEFTNGKSGTDPTATNLVGRWWLDESTGTTAYDSSGNDNHGTHSGGVTHVTDADVPYSAQNQIGYSDGGGGVLVPADASNPGFDALGGALDYTGQAPRPPVVKASNVCVFDGANDYVDHGVIVLSGDYTIHLVAKRSSGTSYMLFGGGDSSGGSDHLGYLWYTGTGWNVRYDGEIGGGTLSAANLTQDVLQHVAITRSGTTLTLYIDGVAVDSLTEGTIETMSVRWLGTSYSLSYTFDGTLSDHAIYDKALTADEVTYLYTHGASGTDPTTANLVEHWPLAEGAGGTCYGKNGNHGTAMNVTLSSFRDVDDVRPSNLLDGFDEVGYFDGASYVDVTLIASQLSVTGDHSGSIKFRWDGTANAVLLASTITAGLDQFVIREQTGSLRIAANNGVTVSVSTSFTDTNDWHTLTWNYISATNTLTATLDSTPMAGSDIPSFAGAVKTYIGAQTNDSAYWGGKISDVNINGGSRYLLDGDVQDSSGLGNHGTNNGVEFAKVPTATDGTSLIHGGEPTNPAGEWNNAAESLIDFTGGITDGPPPWVGQLEADLSVTIPTAHAFGDALPANMEVTTATNKESKYKIRSTV